MSTSKLKYQKIIKVGNSLAVTLDRDFVTQTGIQAGDEMAVDYDADQNVVSYSPLAHSVANASGVAEPKPTYQSGMSQKKAKLASKITPELEAWVDKFLEEDKEILDRLANL